MTHLNDKLRKLIHRQDQFISNLTKFKNYYNTYRKLLQLPSKLAKPEHTIDRKIRNFKRL